MRLPLLLLLLPGSAWEPWVAAVGVCRVMPVMSVSRVPSIQAGSVAEEWVVLTLAAVAAAAVAAVPPAAAVLLLGAGAAVRLRALLAARQPLCTCQRLCSSMFT